MSLLSRISLANRKLVALIAVLVVALGVYATAALKQQLLPDLSFPAVTVVAQYPGAAPEVVEQQVAVPLEGAVNNLDGVESMTSTSQQGSATVLLRFDFDADLDAAADDVSAAVAKLASTLPSGVDPQVVTGSTGDLPTMVLAATGAGDGDRLRDTVVPELEAIDGVNEVTLTGTREQIVTVTPKAGAPVQSLTAALQSLGGTAAAGSITSDGKDLSLAVGRAVTSLDQVRNLWVAPGRQLKDVATATLTDAPATSITRTDGEPSLGLSITMDHGGSAASISDAVRDKLPGLQGDGLRLTVVSDSGPQVKDSVNGLLEEGLLGLVMAVIVILLFLRSARSTLVTAVSIPLSLLIALTVVWTQDYSLNILTLGGLTIAVGRVVDDSIVVLENIKRHLGYGEERGRAIITAVREVSTAVTSSTLTTVAVFLPIALVSGFVGELFGPFSITVTVAMIASLLVSLTVVPALAYWFLRTPKDAAGVPPEVYRERVEAEERRGRLQRVYLPVITWSVRRRKTVLFVAALLLVATAGMATALRTSFLGDSGQDSVSATQTLPAGSDLATTDAAAAKVEQVLGTVAGVESYQVVIGSSGGFLGGGGGANTVTYTVNLAEDADAATVEDAIAEKTTGLSFSDGGGGLGSSDIAVSVTADDDETLRAATSQIQQALTQVPEVTDVSSDLTESSPQISIVAEGEQAAEYGLSDMTIVGALRQATAGTTATQVTIDGTSHDVVVRTGAAAPDSLAEVKALKVPTAAGPVRLDQVATVTLVNGPVQRTRADGERTNTVTATPVGEDTGAAGTAVADKLASLSLPAGAAYETGGVTADQNEAFSQLFLAMGAAIALVFLILVGVFRSIRQTLILLVSIPFAFVGAVALLLVTGTPLGVAALIGILMLIGIVVTNAIVLMDLINQYRERGATVAEAVVEGGLRRLRPILMTALATVFALLPMALGLTGAGGFISQPLAVVVIGGLVSSTLLTLVLIPVLYTMVESRRAPRVQPDPVPERELQPVP